MVSIGIFKVLLFLFLIKWNLDVTLRLQKAMTNHGDAHSFLCCTFFLITGVIGGSPDQSQQTTTTTFLLTGFTAQSYTCPSTEFSGALYRIAAKVVCLKIGRGGEATICIFRTFTELMMYMLQNANDSTHTRVPWSCELPVSWWVLYNHNNTQHLCRTFQV